MECLAFRQQLVWGKSIMKRTELRQAIMHKTHHCFHGFSTSGPSMSLMGYGTRDRDIKPRNVETVMVNLISYWQKYSGAKKNLNDKIMELNNILETFHVFRKRFYE